MHTIVFTIVYPAQIKTVGEAQSPQNPNRGGISRANKTFTREHYPHVLTVQISNGYPLGYSMTF